jgi:flagellar protein FlbT
MTKAMQISLRAGEKLYINGAVIRVDRKVSIELLSDATFLLEGHVLQPSQTTTPLRQLYFVIQTILMQPASAGRARALFERLHASTTESFANPTIREALGTVAKLVADDRIFEALRTIRGLYPIESAILAKVADAKPAEAEKPLAAVAV